MIASVVNFLFFLTVLFLLVPFAVAFALLLRNKHHRRQLCRDWHAGHGTSVP